MKSPKFTHSAIPGSNPGEPPKLKPFKALTRKLSSTTWKGLLSIAALASVLGFATEALALRIGDAGSDVARLQAALGVPVDGLYGPQTASAVASFQRACGLAVDGIAGPQTLSTLYSGSCGGGGFIGLQPPLYQQPPTTGGSSCFNPCTPDGNFLQPGDTSNQGQFIVVVPGNDPSLLAEVRRYVPFAFPDAAQSGPFINAGQFASRSDATLVSNRLRGVGLNARVDFRG